MGVISQLPVDMIHHILSYIDETTIEAGRISIFCKTWYNAWLTFPSLSFEYTLTSPEYVNFINRTFLRYQKQKIPIERLKLQLFYLNYSSAAHVNEWIKIAVQNGVKTLELSFFDNYDLPHIVFEAKSLRELILRDEIRLALMNHVNGKVILFNQLHTLNLSHIYNINDDMFQRLISSCPSIENLFVENCGGLKKIKVSTLCNLKKFTVLGSKSDVEIEAPNLQFLSCGHVRSLKVYKSEKLKYLTLIGDVDFSATLVNNWEHQFPQIENLELLEFKGRLGMTKISSPSLKRLVLNSKDLRYVIIDAPNLVSLELDNVTVIPHLSLTKTQNLLVLKLSTCHRCTLDGHQFFTLKKLLAKGFQCKKIALDLDLTFVDVDEIPNFPMVEVEELELDFHYSITPKLCSNFLGALFRTCHPKAIIVSGYYYLLNILSKVLFERRNRTFSSFIYENLIGRIHGTKSWCQELKEVELKIYDENKHQWQPSDCTSLQEAPSRWNKVMFRLTWEEFAY